MEQDVKTYYLNDDINSEILLSDTPLLYGSDEPVDEMLNDVEFEDDFLYTDETYVNDHTISRMHEANPGNPELVEDGRDIGTIHDEYHMGQVNRMEEDGDVDGLGQDLYDINDRITNIGYTDFATY